MQEEFAKNIEQHKEEIASATATIQALEARPPQVVHVHHHHGGGGKKCIVQ